MCILVLEDNLSRQDTFRRRYPDAVIVATAPDCIERLAEPWDLIYLDHDLGGNKLPDSDSEDCGMVVVRHIIEHEPQQLKATEFIIHSANAHRGRIMAVDLTRAGYNAVWKPYTSLTL